MDVFRDTAIWTNGIQTQPKHSILMSPISSTVCVFNTHYSSPLLLSSYRPNVQLCASQIFLTLETDFLSSNCWPNSHPPLSHIWVLAEDTLLFEVWTPSVPDITVTISHTRLHVRGRGVCVILLGQHRKWLN